MTNYVAQRIRVGPTDRPEIIQGPLDPSLATIGDVVNRLLIFIIPMAVLLLFFILVWGGFDFLASQGDAEKIKGARAKITAGLIGLVLIVFSYGMVKIISYVLGLGGNGLF